MSKSDWKHFNRVKEIALERLCTRILQNVCESATNESKTPHERYLDVYKLVMESNKDIARGFDFHSRSRVISQLLAMQSLEVIDDSDLVKFSDEIRDQLSLFDRLR
jgi:beta-galactosidase beta subunit